MLLDAGADPHARDNEGSTPLHQAAWGGRNLKTIIRLLQEGADPNVQNKYLTTPLHAAASNSIPSVVARLLEAGADPNARDNQGAVPLHYAAQRNRNPGVIPLLVEAGADPNARDRHGDTPLDISMREDGNPEVAAALREAGENFSAKNGPLAGNNKPEEAHVIPHSLTVCPDWNTPEFFKDADAPQVQDCLAAGADPMARADRQITPLHYAASVSDDPGVFKALLECRRRSERARPGGKDAPSPIGPK